MRKEGERKTCVHVLHEERNVRSNKLYSFTCYDHPDILNVHDTNYHNKIQHIFNEKVSDSTS